MKPKIIYIIGAGRSGTTLLDIVLGNAEDIFSAGELNRFSKLQGIPHDARDEKVQQFWKQVKEDLGKENIIMHLKILKIFNITRGSGLLRATR